jgi:hypothetical protein
MPRRVARAKPGARGRGAGGARPVGGDDSHGHRLVNAAEPETMEAIIEQDLRCAGCGHVLLWCGYKRPGLYQCVNDLCEHEGKEWRAPRVTLYRAEEVGDGAS